MLLSLKLNQHHWDWVYKISSLMMRNEEEITLNLEEGTLLSFKIAWILFMNSEQPLEHNLTHLQIQMKLQQKSSFSRILCLNNYVHLKNNFPWKWWTSFRWNQMFKSNNFRTVLVIEHQKQQQQLQTNLFRSTIHESALLTAGF